MSRHLTPGTLVRTPSGKTAKVVRCNHAFARVVCQYTDGDGTDVVVLQQHLLRRVESPGVDIDAVHGHFDRRFQEVK